MPDGENASSKHDELVYGGICPVCGDEFIDGYDDLEENESYEARICVVEIDGEGEGSMLVHLEDTTSDVEAEIDCVFCEDGAMYRDGPKVVCDSCGEVKLA